MNNRKFLFVISFICIGLIGIVPFPPYNFLPLFSVISLSTFFSFMLWGILKAKTKKQAFFFPYLLSLIPNIILFDWLRMPFKFVGLSFIAPLVVLLFVICWSLFYGFVGLLVFKVDKSKQFFAFAFFISFFEWVKSWIFTGFPWNPISLSWSSFLPVMQTLSLIGSLGLSFITILFITLPLFIIKNRDFLKKKYFYFNILIACFVLAFGYFRLFKYKDFSYLPKKIRIVNLNLSLDDKRDDKAFFDYINISNLKGIDNVDLVIWPETSIPYDLFRDDFALMYLLNSLKDKLSLIAGFNRVQIIGKNDFKLFNTMILLDKSGILDFYDKKHLVPFGEYIPFKSFLPIEKFTAGMLDFSKGEQNVLFSFGDLSIYPLICFEAIFSALRLANDVDFIVNISNDKWFAKSGKYQHFDIVKYRAVEEGVPLIRVANDGISALISPLGNLVQGNFIDANSNISQTSYIDQVGVFDVSLIKRFDRTIFSFIGNYFILFLFIIGFLYLYFDFFKKKLTNIK